MVTHVMSADVAAGDTILATQQQALRFDINSPFRPQDRWPNLITHGDVFGQITENTAGAPSITRQGTVVTLAVDANVNEHVNFRTTITSGPAISSNWDLYFFSSINSATNAAVTFFMGIVTNPTDGILPVGGTHDFAGIRANSTNVSAVCGDGAAETTSVISTFTGSHTSGSSFRIRRVSSSVYFYVNGVLRATISANLPNTGNGNLYLILDSAGTGAAVTNTVIIGQMAIEEVP